jgi:radical SAM superfamily enzyme
VDQVVDEKSSDVEKIGFSMMMVKLGGCITCSADSFRAMRGCTHCATQTIRRFRGSDEELKTLFKENVKEVKNFYDKYKPSGKGEQ